MSLQSLSNLGVGGAGLSGQSADSLFAILREVQGLNVSVIAGAGANTKLNLAAIRDEDTIIGALNNNAGTITDIKANVTIEDLRAKGTITFSTGATVANETITVNGKVYTAKAAPVVANREFLVTAVFADAAASLVAAINYAEARALNEVVASNLAGVVTVAAVVEGTGGNAITLTEAATNVALSGATLSGGTATGGIKSSSVTNQVILFWFNKK